MGTNGQPAVAWVAMLLPLAGVAVALYAMKTARDANPRKPAGAVA